MPRAKNLNGLRKCSRKVAVLQLILYLTVKRRDRRGYVKCIGERSGRGRKESRGVTEQTREGGANDTLLPNGPTLVLGGPLPRTRFALPATRERCLSMPEIGEKERDFFI